MIALTVLQTAIDQLQTAAEALNFTQQEAASQLTQEARDLLESAIRNADRAADDAIEAATHLALGAAQP